MSPMIPRTVTMTVSDNILTGLNIHSPLFVQIHQQNRQLELVAAVKTAGNVCVRPVHRPILLAAVMRQTS
jgi:hypothetical protein